MHVRKQTEEDRILRLAVREGLLSEEDVRSIELPPGRQTMETGTWGPRIQRLLSTGRLQESSIHRLIRLDREESETVAEAPAGSTFIMGEDFAPSPTIQPVQREHHPPGFPVRDWDRYQFVQFLGEGGMGTVFKAFDPRLKRNVALKFIRGDDERHKRRFLQEAQAQARVEHPNVCKIYEVGEVEDKLFIAMQFIDGMSLDRAQAAMTLEEKVAVMQDVSEGIHAAHRLGLIHRDIKPGNIMVEKREGTKYHPYVMDFGLARLTESNSEMTQAGFVLGTPAYMSPEQASGGAQPLDRRSDVFSLGATLYALLCGRTPFGGNSALEVLSNIATLEPEPVSSYRKEVPRDLDTIVMKCLEKDPVHRYDSARGLADDLSRFLNREPIQGRPASWTYRLGKKARKHRGMVAVSAAALAIIASLVLFSVHARLVTARQARLAQQFGREVERMEAVMRYGYMSRLHDVNREKAIVRNRMAAVRSMMQALGGGAKGPGEYALGRGSAALHEYDTARQLLESAWKDGYRQPEVSYTLGLVLGAQYEAELDSADRIPDAGQREAKKKELERTLKQPAVSYLRQSTGASLDASDYGEARIAYYDRRYDEALSRSERALRQVPWLYEARKVQADVFYRRGGAERDSGHYDRAAELFARADESYRQAIREAESDPELYLALARNWLAALSMNIYSGQGDPSSSFDRIIDACKGASAADPRNPEAPAGTSQAYSGLAVYLQDHGRDPMPDIRNAIDFATRAVAIDDRSVIALSSAALAYSQSGLLESSRGEDPRKSLNTSIAWFRKAAEIKADDSIYTDEGDTYRVLAEYEMDHGGNPIPSLTQAISCFQAATRINPRNGNCYNNLGVANDLKGSYEATQGMDPVASWTAAIQYYRKAVELSPGLLYGYSNQAIPYLWLAAYRLDKGADPSGDLQNAEDLLKKAIAANPNHANFHANLAAVYGTRARYLASRSQDPSQVIAMAMQALDTAVKISPDDYSFRLSQAQIELQEAEYRQSRKQPAVGNLRRARESLDQAFRMTRDDADCYLAEATWCALEASAAGNGATIIQRGLRAVDRAVALAGPSQEATTLKQRLLALQKKIP